MHTFTSQMGARYKLPTAILQSSYLVLVLMTAVIHGSADDIITQSKHLSGTETIISSGKSFELGFFSPANSSNQYLGIWYKHTSIRKVVWVANRENPLAATDSACSLIIGNDGNLRLLDGAKNPVWWTNVTSQSNKSVAVLSENGDFILRDNISGLTLWESFDYPGNVLLPGMILGLNTKTGEKRVLLSWKSEDDPSPGVFVGELKLEKPPQAFIWNGSKPYWRSGPWDGGKFNGIEGSEEGYMSAFKVQSDNQQESFYLTMDAYNSSYIIMMSLQPTGSLEIAQRDGAGDLYLKWVLPANECDKYGLCGPFGVCKKKSEICECLKGFVPYSADDWREGNWTGGCVRRTELLCQKNSSSASGNHKVDGFFKLEALKLPDQFEYLFNVQDSSSCQEQCTSNCSCVAYAYAAKIGCMVWNEVLVDTQQFSFAGDELFIRLAHSELGKDDKKEKVIISFATISAVILIGALIYGMYRHRASQSAAPQKKNNRMKGLFSDDITEASCDTTRENAKNAMHEESTELPLLEFGKVLVATNNFSTTNKLGEGGFGSVYKGKLENGQEVAVKRLSSHSGQGVQEFKNEIILISKLQHRNLVRLCGCCIDGEEKILVYEYMTNKSLDTFLFDAKRGAQLDWTKRFEIIMGIAKGLLYLHRDSRLRIIHRDLKASNILLDNNMDPKISDFGLARTFQATQETANTHRVAGTFGYMSPEYAIGGLFSEKSDVYSFGVLLLEIVSGMKNTGFYNNEKYLHLLGYVWQLWEEKRGMDLLDQALADRCAAEDVVRCIQIGLLCVQDHAADRPTMPNILVMLSSKTDLPQPKEPKFTFQSLLDTDLGSSNKAYSKNELSVTVVEGR